MIDVALLFLAGAAGGALNSVAGGGSFIVFPTLLFTGMPPVAANATTTVALWPAGLTSTWAYRKELPPDKKLLVLFAIASAVGGALGGELLLVTSDETFVKILPWLLLVASTVFSFGKKIGARANGATLPLFVGAIIQLVISTYGGYFGGGMGILMLATYTLMGMTRIHTMNGLKTMLGVLINGVAVILFVAAGKAVVSAALPAIVGSLAGGWGGAALARRVPESWVRRVVLVIAWSLTAYFFYRATLR